MTADPESDERTLTLVGEPALWDVTLTDGTTLTIAAHAYGQEDDTIVFSFLMDGSPRFEVDVLRVPASHVTRILTIG